jgi:hypothetical protein
VGNGWWNDLIGVNKTIDTTKYTVLAFNVPGNGFDGAVIENYFDFKLHLYFRHSIARGYKTLRHWRFCRELKWVIY